MQKLHFSLEISAPREKVWKIMLDEATYREWTKAFGENNYYKGDWNKGSSIQFLGVDAESGIEMGMTSRIAENRLHEFVSIEHLGIVANGVEDTTSENARQWSPAFENYTFIERDGATEVQVDLDTPDEYADAFRGMWTDALQRLKTLCEA